jgi:non-ribosomal peptide synthetase component E (peptide arylation enzyme)
VIGFVEAPAGTDGAAVQAYLRAHVPAARAPDRLVLVAAFPRGRDGKADRRRLVAAASGTIGKT